MPKTLLKSRLHSNKHKPKIKQEPNNTKSNSPPNLQTFKQTIIRKRLCSISLVFSI